MVAVKFYLFIVILSWAIFNVAVAQNMKKRRRPDKSQVHYTNGGLTAEIGTRNHVKVLDEE